MITSADEPQEPGRENLLRAVAQLPQHEPAPTAWPWLAQQLAAEEAIRSAIPQLPEHAPDDAMWARLSAKLEAAAAPLSAEPQPVPATRAWWPWMSGVAAALLLLLGVWYLALRPAGPPRETVTYAVEDARLPVPAPLTRPGELEQEGQNYIEAHCAAMPTACASPEFEALHTQLAEITDQEQELRQASLRFGQSPELEREQTRLAILKATLTRELVRHIIS